MIDGMLRGVGLFLVSPSPSRATSQPPVPAASIVAISPVTHDSCTMPLVRVCPCSTAGVQWSTSLHPTLPRAGRVNLGLLGHCSRGVISRGIAVLDRLDQDVVF
jgi:hypothetical protein